MGSAAHAQIVNGGFETGDFTGWTITSSDANPIAAGVNTAPGNFYNVPQSNVPDGGTRFAAFGGGDAVANAILSQTFATVSGDPTASLSLAYGNWGNGNPQSLRVTLIDTLTSTTLFTTDIVDNTATTDGASPTLFTTYSFNFTPTGAQTTLRLQDITANSSSADGLLDAVVVTAAVAAPEPGTWALVALGAFVPLVGLARRRR